MKSIKSDTSNPYGIYTIPVNIRKIIPTNDIIPPITGEIIKPTKKRVIVMIAPQNNPVIPNVAQEFPKSKINVLKGVRGEALLKTFAINVPVGFVMRQVIIPAAPVEDVLQIKISP